MSCQPHPFTVFVVLSLLHISRLAASTHCHPYSCSSHCAQSPFFVWSNCEGLRPQVHVHSENTTLEEKDRQQKKRQQWIFAGKNFQSACSYPEECEPQSFWGKKYVDQVSFGSLRSFPNFFWKAHSVAGDRKTHTWEACLSFPCLSSSWAFLRGTGSPCWWPGPRLCGEECSYTQTFQLLLKPNGTLLNPGPHPLFWVFAGVAMATKCPPFMFPLPNSAPSSTPLWRPPHIPPLLPRHIEPTGWGSKHPPHLIPKSETAWKVQRSKGHQNDLFSQGWPWWRCRLW